MSLVPGHQRSDSGDEPLQIEADVMYLGSIIRFRITHGNPEQKIHYRTFPEISFGNIVPVSFPHGLDSRLRFRVIAYQVLEYAGGEDRPDLAMVEQDLISFGPEVHLHREDQRQEAVEGAVLHRKAHRDIDVLDVGRNGIQDRQQQGFVRDDNSIGVILQDGRQKLCLSHRRRYADNFDFRCRQPLGVIFERLRKLLHIRCHEEGTLVAGIPDHL